MMHQGWQVSRLENLPDVRTLLRLSRAPIEQYCASFRQVPRRIILDVDDTFDRVHGALKPPSHVHAAPVRSLTGRRGWRRAWALAYKIRSRCPLEFAKRPR